MLYLETRNAPHDGGRTAPDGHQPDAVARLRPLLAAAGELDLQDQEGWIRLRHAARVTTAALAVAGALPDHLAVGPDDPPALITRTIAAAWRHATSAPSRQLVER